MYLAHPWLLDLNRWRLPLAPHVLDAEEAMLRTLSSTGLPPTEVAGLVDVVTALVHGYSRSAVAERREDRSSDAYWEAMSSFWSTHFDPERYPTITRTWMSGGFDAATGDLAGTLRPLLDGLESRIAAG